MMVDHIPDPHGLQTVADPEPFGRWPHHLPLRTELEEQYLDFVVRNLRRLGVSAPRSSSATAAVFEHLEGQRAEFRGQASLRGWVFRCICEVAAHERGQTGGWGDARVAPLLGSMPVEDAELWVFSELEGGNGPEMAAWLGRGLTAVYRRVREVRARVSGSASDRGLRSPNSRSECG